MGDPSGLRAMLGARVFAVLGLVGLLAAAPAALWAQAVTKDQVIADLELQGFTVIEAGTTFLGRIRIMAAGPEGTREVVLNPRNGKVLRDIIVRDAGGIPLEAPRPTAGAPVPEASGATVEATRGAGDAAAVVLPELPAQAAPVAPVAQPPAAAGAAQDRALDQP